MLSSLISAPVAVICDVGSHQRLQRAGDAEAMVLSPGRLERQRRHRHDASGALATIPRALKANRNR